MTRLGSKRWHDHMSHWLYHCIKLFKKKQTKLENNQIICVIIVMSKAKFESGETKLRFDDMDRYTFWTKIYSEMLYDVGIRYVCLSMCWAKQTDKLRVNTDKVALWWDQPTHFLDSGHGPGIRRAKGNQILVNLDWRILVDKRKCWYKSKKSSHS